MYGIASGQQMLNTAKYTCFFQVILDLSPSRLCHAVCPGCSVSNLLHTPQPLPGQCHLHHLLCPSRQVLGEGLQVGKHFKILFHVENVCYLYECASVMCDFKSSFSAAPKEWITPTLGWPLSWTEIQVSASLSFLILCKGLIDVFELLHGLKLKHFWEAWYL